MRRTTLSLLACTALLTVLTAGAIAGCFVDPVHDQELAQLGPEPAGESPGPLHRPGQPCLVCHGGAGPASQKFSVAGTVFAIQGETMPMPSATVSLTDSHDAGIAVQTNAAGNFYMTPSVYEPYWPLHAAVTYKPPGASTPNLATMISHIGRNGSCAGCHTVPANNDSPGSVYMYFDPSSVPDGGIP
jgi:hypothetical protein